MDEPVIVPAMSSWAVVAAAWQRFKALVDALDEAVSSALAERSRAAFKRAEALVGEPLRRQRTRRRPARR